LTVSAFGQTSGFDNPFTIQTPVIQSFSPQEVYPGEEVVIQGFSFPEHTDYLEVFFNGVIAEVISSSYSSIKVLAPFPSDSMNTIQIRCDRQRVYSDNQIKVCLPDKAIISPTSGTFLDRISIQGPGIGDTHLYIRNVTIGSSITHIIERNLNEIIVEVPEWIGPNESVVRINYENDTIICSNTFFLNEVEINSLSDNSIVAGEDLHIYGNNFNPNKVRNRVFIGDSLYYPYEASSSQLKVRTSISQPAGDYIVAVQTCGSVVPFAELLNIIQSPWTELSGFPSGILIGSGSCSDGEYGYVGLGKSYSGFMEDIYQYSVSYDDWNKIADFPGQPRTNPLSFVIDGKVFFGGGKDGAPAYNNPQSYFDYYEYDPDLDQWGDILVYPGTSSYDYNGTSEVVNGRCYISSDSYEFYEFTRGETQPWRRLSTPADGIYSQAASFSLGDVIYFVGGLDKRTSTSVKKSEVWAYNTNSNTWEKKSDIPAGVRYDGVAFVIDGMAYFGLGADFYLQDDLWRYDPQDDQWTFVSRMPPGGRLNPFCFVIGNIAYLGLGTSGYSPTFTDIYSFEPAY
jgi:N-acetylneuraminic acid mutarotase